MEREQFELENLLESEVLDEAAVMEQFKRLEKARGNLSAERFDFILEVKERQLSLNITVPISIGSADTDNTPPKKDTKILWKFTETRAKLLDLPSWPHIIKQ